MIQLAKEMRLFMTDDLVGAVPMMFLPPGFTRLAAVEDYIRAKARARLPARYDLLRRIFLYKTLLPGRFRDV